MIYYERVLQQEAWENYKQSSFVNAIGGGKPLPLPEILRG